MSDLKAKFEAAVAASKSLQDHERPVQSRRPLDCPLETEIPMSSPVGNHPVQDKLAVRPRRSIVEGANTEVRNGHSCCKSRASTGGNDSPV